MLMPNKAAAAINHSKLEVRSAKVASSTAAAADSEDREKLRRLPIARMSMVAGIVVEATLTTMIDTGRVASAALSERFAPIIPPSVTTTIDPVADMS